MRARALVVGSLLVVVGLFTAAVALWAQGSEFGWFAYAGSAYETSPRLFVMTARREFALVLAGLGLLLLGSLGGFAVGRRARSRSRSLD